MIANAEYLEKIGEPNSPIQVTFSARSISGVSIIIQTLSNESLQDKKYSLEVSNNEKWGFIKVRDVSMGSMSSFDESYSLFTDNIYTNILHFSWIRLTVPPIDEGVTVRVVISKR